MDPQHNHILIIAKQTKMIQLPLDYIYAHLVLV